MRSIFAVLYSSILSDKSQGCARFPEFLKNLNERHFVRVCAR